LTNVNVLVTDDDMMIQYLNEANNTGKVHSADDFPTSCSVLRNGFI